MSESVVPIERLFEKLCFSTASSGQKAAFCYSASRIEGVAPFAIDIFSTYGTCAYTFAVVAMSECPSHSWICLSEKPCWSSRVATECPYGIITTNRKSPVGSRVLRFSV